MYKLQFKCAHMINIHYFNQLNSVHSYLFILQMLTKMIHS